MRYSFHFPDRASHVSGAVLSCIKDLEFRQDMIRGNERLRTAFIERVIDRLNALLQVCPDQNLETIIRKSQQSIPEQSFLVTERLDGVSRSKSLQRENQMPGFAIADPQSGYCLHDNEIREPYDANK